MASGNVCWGIEVGSGAITALKLENAGDRINVLDFAILEHKKVLSTPGLDQDDAMRVALGALASQFDLSGATIAVSVPGHAAFARFAKLPPVEPKGVPGIVRFEAKQQIPFPLEDVEWDYQTFANPDSPDVEVGIFAMTREKIMQRLAMLQDVNLVPDILTLSPIAVYNAMAHDMEFSEQTQGTILLDVGTTSTDLIIAEAGRVWVRTFPIGGHHFTEALVEAFSTSYPKAEKLKREGEQDKNARLIFQKMRPVFQDLAQEVQRSIGYYQSLHKDAKLTRLIGMGSTFRLPGIRRFLKSQLQLNVYRLESFKQISVDGPRAGEFQNASINLATAYGLAIQGLGMATLEANLMPVAAIRRAMWQRKVKWWGVAAGVAVVGSGSMFIRPFLDSQEVNANPRPAVISQTLARADSLKRNAQDVTSAAAADYTAANLLTLAGRRDIYPHLVNDLGLIMAAADAASVKWDKPAGVAEEARLPVLALKSFQTEYLGPGGGEGSPEGSDPSVPDERPPRIKVTLKVTTLVPQAPEFVTATIDPWLWENAKRPGVPYVILKKKGDPPSWQLEGTRAASRAGPTGSETAPPPRGSSETRQPVGRPPDREAPRPNRGTARPQPTPPPAGEGEGPRRPGGSGQEGMTPAPGSEDLRNLAPLPIPEGDVVPEGAEQSIFEISWVVELTTAKKEDGQ